MIFGLAIAVVLFAINYSQVDAAHKTFSGVNCQSHVQRYPNVERLLEQKGDRIYIIELQGFIFFGTASKLVDKIRSKINAPGKLSLCFLLLDFRLVSGLDSSAIVSFAKLKQIASKEKVCLQLIFTNLTSKWENQFQKGNVITIADSICKVFPDLNFGLEWCENKILEKSKLRRQHFLPFAMQLRKFLTTGKDAAKLISYMQPLELEAGEFLFHQGDAYDGIYFVESGQVSIIKEINGKNIILRTYSNGTILGEMGLYRQAPRSASVLADLSSRVYYLSTEAFEQIEAEDPLLAATFHKSIVNLLADRLEQTQAKLRYLL